ncbi:tetratricopeptide repeat protein [Billgrantia saliphila]|uniref:tetratricopeptide repeat protein n=1 Tax=Billgrantia saliphila TaxID=1848458 RepID=UPI0018CC690F|nr:hypothetical protein [Halomonas saliphila]
MRIAPATLLLLTTCVWLATVPAVTAAPPALPGDVIADLERLQQQLQQGADEAAGERARTQARRLEGGNAADRWASALYLQLLAGAETQAGRYEAAAEALHQARQTQEAPQEQRDRWLREEARMRIAAGQRERGAELLSDWLQRHEGGPADYWRLARTLAELERWEEAARWAERALAMGEAPDARQQRLANIVLQRAGKGAEALAALEAELNASSEAADWRRAAALAQGLGDPVRAAALWEAGWRLGVLAGEGDLEQRIELHLAAGTPARAAELLEVALTEEALPDTLANRRLLARAWEEARARERALEAWRTVAERSGEGDDWQRLGLLASAWGRLELAQEAMQQAQVRGVDVDERWFTTR